MNVILIFFALKYKGNWDAIYKALEEKEKVSMAEITETEKKVEELLTKGIKAVTILDVNYPNSLKEAYKPSFVIFYKGDIKALDKQSVNLTGDNVDTVSLDRAAKLIKDFKAKEIAIVKTGKTAFDKELLTIDSGTSIFVTTSSVEESNIELKDGDVIITEAPEGSNSDQRNTNRIIAAVSTEGTVLVNSLTGSDHIHHLVSSFLNLGKDIFAMPGDGSEQDGNSELIKQGATLLTKAEDVLQ